MTDPTPEADTGDGRGLDRETARRSIAGPVSANPAVRELIGRITEDRQVRLGCDDPTVGDDIAHHRMLADQPRRWTGGQVQILEDLSAAAHAKAFGT